MPVDVIEANIASAIDLVVQMQRGADGARFVSDIVSLRFDRSEGRCFTQPIYARAVGSDAGSWESCPDWVNDLPFRNLVDEEEVDEWKRVCSLV